ncbi:MAG: dockerin type I domain-containing protein [bacterium]
MKKKRMNKQIAWVLERVSSIVTEIIMGVTAGIIKGITIGITAGALVLILPGILTGKGAWAASVGPAAVCTRNDQCQPEEYCQKQAGDCQGEGVCRHIPRMCPANYDWVCGCDGRTYGNYCDAAVGSVNVERSGRCIPGDLNIDDQITPQDALIAFQCYLVPECYELNKDAADVNQDGQVTPADALCLFRKYLGQTSCLDLVKLHCIEFFHQSHLPTAEYLATMLGTRLEKTGTDYKVVPVASQPVGLGWEGEMKWIRKGYEYTTGNGGRITIWVDASDRTYAVTYLLKRLGTSSGWSWDQEKILARMKDILHLLGVVLTGAEEFSMSKNSAGPGSHWYDFSVKQKFGDTTLSYPGIFAEIEGDTGEINFLKIYRWYDNLHEIKVILPDEDLKEKAADYYTLNSLATVNTPATANTTDAANSPGTVSTVNTVSAVSTAGAAGTMDTMDTISPVSQEGISIPDNLAVEGLYIIKDRLCKKIGGAAIDEWGSTLHLFIDVQTGQVVDTERLLVDSLPDESGGLYDGGEDGAGLGTGADNGGDGAGMGDGLVLQDAARSEPPEGLMLLIEYEGMDGLTNFVYELQKRAIPSLLLASADFVAQHAEDLRKLQGYGMEVGALCSPSPPMWDVPYEEQYAIIKDRKERIDACLGKPIKAIASTYFAYDVNTLKVAEALGIPFVMARGTTGSRATIYQPEGYMTRIFSVSNVSSEKWGTGSLCDYSYWAREGTPAQFSEELFDAALQQAKISPVSHARIGGLKAAWNAVYLDFLDHAFVHWVSLDIFGAVDARLPLDEIPQNRQVEYTTPKPAKPLEEEPNLDNPCLLVSDFPPLPGQGSQQDTQGSQEDKGEGKIIIFHNGSGPMCLAALDFLKTLDYPVEQHLVSDEDFRERLNELKAQFGSSEGLSETFGYLPIIFLKDSAYSGFNDQVKKGIMQAILGVEETSQVPLK